MDTYEETRRDGRCRFKDCTLSYSELQEYALYMLKTPSCGRSGQRMGSPRDATCRDHSLLDARTHWDYSAVLHQADESYECTVTVSIRRNFSEDALALNETLWSDDQP